MEIKYLFFKEDCIMYDYNKMKRNYEIIKEVSKKYRIEFTALQSAIAEYYGLTTSSDYEKFTNELSDDEFTANLLSSLYVDDVVDKFKELIDDKISFDDYIDEFYGQYGLDEIVELYYKNISK